MPEEERTTLTVSVASVSQLRELARRLGFVNPVGKHIGQGNISAMLDAVGRGDFVIVPATKGETSASQEVELAALRAALEQATERFETAIAHVLAALDEEPTLKPRIKRLLADLGQIQPEKGVANAEDNKA